MEQIDDIPFDKLDRTGISINILQSNNSANNNSFCYKDRFGLGNLALEVVFFF